MWGVVCVLKCHVILGGDYLFVTSQQLPQQRDLHLSSLLHQDLSPGICWSHSWSKAVRWGHSHPAVFPRM